MHAPINESVFQSIQPQAFAWLTATSSPAIAATISNAPSASMRWPEATRLDLGTQIETASSATTADPAPTRKIHCHGKWSTMTPPRKIANPAETNAAADTTPTPNGTRAGGRFSRAMPKHNGRMAPDRPWIDRPTMMPSTESDSALTMDPMNATPSTISSTRLRPYMSPRRAQIDADAAATSRNAVTIQPTITASPNRWKNVRRPAKIMVASTALTTSASTSAASKSAAR